MNTTIEYIQNNMTNDEKINVIKDWDEYNTTLVIPRRSLLLVEDLKILLYPKDPDSLNTVFWFKELYVGVCRVLADNFIRTTNIYHLYKNIIEKYNG